VNNLIFLGIIGLSFGALSASGVLTVLTAVGLVPRYVGRVHEAKHILLFENMIIGGTMSGTIVTLFGVLADNSGLGFLGILIQSMYGLFSGIFVGTLALAIAEMLDAFPIFFRRLKLTGGLVWIVLSIALGKMTGSFIYFYFRLYDTVPR
jgi:stage V sporulation protein AB